MNWVEASRDTKKNERAILHLETRLFEHKRRYNIYTLFEETPEYYEWTVGDIRLLETERRKRTYIEDLAYTLGRSTEEIAMAIFDREIFGSRFKRGEDDEEDFEDREYILFDKNPEFCYWPLLQVVDFDEAYKQKKSVQTLSEMFKRTQEEIALLIFDRAIKNKI